MLPTEADLPKQLREARVLQPLLEEALRCCDGPAEDLASTPLSPSPRHPSPQLRGRWDVWALHWRCCEDMCGVKASIWGGGQ